MTALVASLSSAWERSASGPDRRIYQLTRAGTEELHERAKAVAQTKDTLETFVARYSEFVALAKPRKRTGARS